MDNTNQIKCQTVNLTGQEVEVTCGKSDIAVRNDGTGTIYVSAEPGVVHGANGVVSVPEGGSAVVSSPGGKLYITGNGPALILVTEHHVNPFKTSAQSGGSGADTVARAAIEAHTGNGEIHVTAAEKEKWNGKAELADIPTTLPANGGNADTLDGLHAGSFLGSGVFEYWSSNGSDANSITYDFHGFVFGALNTPFWYCFLDVRRANAAGFAPNSQQPIIVQTAICYNTSQVAIRQSVDNGNSWADWTLLSDGGNAASVGTYTEEKLAALEARIAALE